MSLSHRSRRVALTLAAVAAVAAALLAALAPQAPAAKQAYNRTDAIFAAQMLPHHQGGIELGKLAVEKGVNEEIKSIGADIVEAQTRESKQLQRMVARFDTKPFEVPEVAERSDIDMQRLQQASGTDFDRMWLDVISAHHMGAIQMATMETHGGKAKSVRRLAARIVKQQREELARFNALSRQLG